MKEKQKYIITQDTQATFASIGGNTERELTPTFIRAADQYLNFLASSLHGSLDGGVEIRTYSKPFIDKELQSVVIGELTSDPNTVCICLDRFLLGDVEMSDDYGNRFFRFDISRSSDDRKVPRQGGVPFSEQINKLRESIPELDSNHLIIVDSGVFSGGTIRVFLDTLSEEGIEAPVKKIICFVSGKTILEEAPSLEAVEPVEDLHDWVEIRDFSPFGGKILNSSITNRVSAAIPYLYPWSNGINASLDMSPHLFTVSQSMTEEFRKLVLIYEAENGGKPLRFRQLVKRGFSLPTSLERRIPISINDSVVEYLDRCIELIQVEQSRPVMVFDMDGTLYELDSEDGGFHGSSLDSLVLQNARQFIRAREGNSDLQMEEILQAGLNDPIGLSVYLSKRYGISRADYFDSVWNISPEGIIKDNKHATETIQLLQKNPELKIVLLTSSPRAWALRVLKHLKISDFFESIYTGEQYGQKEEVFRILASRYKPGNIISIGDQYETDIEPAQKLEMQTFQVGNPGDLKKLLNMYS